MNANCRFCRNVCENDSFNYDCSSCGKYGIENFLRNTQKANEIGKLFANNRELINKNLHNIRGYIHEKQNQNEKGRVIFTQDRIQHVINLKDLKPREKLEKLLMFFHKNSEFSETLHIEINANGDAEFVKDSRINLIPVVWGKDAKEIFHIIDQGIKDELFETVGNERQNARKIRITQKGSEYIEELENTSSHMGFCAMWFDTLMDAPWEKSIKQAIKGAEYHEKRIDKHDHNNVILEEVEDLIRKSRFVVADLTEQRCNVYFEAGFAKALQIPIIYTCEENSFKDIHFDIRHFNCLIWKKNHLEDFKEKLQKRIENTLGKGRVRKENL